MKASASCTAFLDISVSLLCWDIQKGDALESWSQIIQYSSKGKRSLNTARSTKQSTKFLQAFWTNRPISKGSCSGWFSLPHWAWRKDSIKVHFFDMKQNKALSAAGKHWVLQIALRCLKGASVNTYKNICKQAMKPVTKPERFKLCCPSKKASSEQN